jgi:hypothetical protein
MSCNGMLKYNIVNINLTLYIMYIRDTSSIPGIGTRFSLFHSVQTGSRAHPVPYTMGSGSCFTGSKEEGT